MNLYFRLLWLVIRSRRWERLSLWDVAETPFRVTLTDLDLMRHMNNGKYLSLLDLGRMDLMFRSGYWAKISKEGWYPVVAAQTISYRKSLGLGQRFDLRTKVLGFDDRSIYVEQTFCVGDTIYARAVVRARLLKRTGGTVEREEFERLAGGIPESLELPEWVSRWAEDSRLTETTFD